MPMSPMAMCQLLCGAGDGFQYTNSAFPFGTSGFPKNLACGDFLFVSYISAQSSGDFFIVCFMYQLSGIQEQQNWEETTKKHPKLGKPLWPYQTMHQCCGSFSGWVFWMDVASTGGRYLWPSPKKTWWFQRFLHVYTQDLRKLSTNMSKTLKLLIGRLWCSILGCGDLYHRVSIQVLKKLQGRRSCRSFGQWIASSTWCCRHQFLASCWPRPILKDQNTTSFTFHVSRSLFRVVPGSSSGGLRQCLSFKARNQFFNSGSGALKKLNFTFFVVVSLYIYIYISVNIVVGGLFWENHGGGC